MALSPGDSAVAAPTAWHDCSSRLDLASHLHDGLRLPEHLRHSNDDRGHRLSEPFQILDRLSSVPRRHALARHRLARRWNPVEYHLRQLLARRGDAHQYRRLRV